MKLVLNIYADDTLSEIKRVVEVDRLKIPYKVALYVAESLDTIDFKNNDDVYNFIMKSIDKVHKIVKATFGVSETELECVDVMELGEVGKEIYQWAIEKFNSLNKNGDPKNV